MIPELEQRRFRSHDGTEIAYQVRGQGPVVVLANGLGGTCEAYRHIYAALGKAYRLISWDYRGLYGSQRPHDLATLAVTHQVRDLDRLLALEEVERAVFIGWSMGVQVNFEYHKLRADRFAGICAINGTYGSPFNSALSSRLTRYVIPSALAVMQAQARTVSRLTARSVEWRGLLPLLQRMGMVSATCDAEAFVDLSRGFATMDFDCYARTLRLLGSHDARDVLARIDVPTAIITGDRDLLTPVFTAEKMARAIRGATLTVIPGGTHYTPVEYPEVVIRSLRELLARVPSHAPAAVAARADASTPTPAAARPD